MITTLAVNCMPILPCTKDDGKCVAETASNKMVMGAVQALYEFSLLVSQKNYSDLSLNALDNELKQFYQIKVIFREQKL
jgi:hypothetical protein